ncbi:nitroreductase/quinone reductase family protein [Streptomyces sp. NPDC046977]|uniref:nitroreductase/quinone reductase family protein n=1 Tax=Streptomyces sp. NPDC046977 TaxID=3154703 RepID=UPI0033CC1385
MSDRWADANAQVIDQFRANVGVVGGPFEGKQILLVHHVGRRTGEERVTPLVAARDGDAYLVCGTAGGAPRDPVWVANIEVGPRETTIEIGARPLRVAARVVRSTSPEWDRLYRIWSAYWPDAALYETRTSRAFPIVRLEPLT